MAENPRYDGKPLLRLAELYVLRAIGELSQAEEDKLAAMAPNLRKTYGVDGAWHEVIAHALKFPPNAAEIINTLWQKSAAMAKANKVPLAPQTFAEMFVDSNVVN
ncbi:MAG TPA: hypothetical protein VG841_15520 [Caulobacterales bacterium]|nr:hypothetical protein [Caulobacterales bacterium]